MSPPKIMKLLKSAILLIMVHLFVFPLIAENRPGMLGGGNNQNSSPTSVGQSLEMKWFVLLDPLQVCADPIADFSNGSIRSANLSFRDGELMLLTPNASWTDIGFFDASTGLMKRSFPTDLTDGQGGWMDLWHGQVAGYWHKNGNVHLRVGGDNRHLRTYRASDGRTMPPVGESTANAMSCFFMTDESNWMFHGHAGHKTAISKSVLMQDIGGILPVTLVPIAKSSGPVSYFMNRATMLMEGDWLYTYGPYASEQIGSSIKGFKVRGQTPILQNQGFVNGEAGIFEWNEPASFTHYLTSKPLCLGKNHIFLVTQSGVDLSGSLPTIDFSKPLRLHTIDRQTGTETFRKNLGITGLGGTTSLWSVQIAYADRKISENREYIATIFKEADTVGPTSTNPNMQTRLSVVDAVTQTELWIYQYPHGQTGVDALISHSACTLMTIAGDALYVVYVKTSPILNFRTPMGWYKTSDQNNEYDLTLYVDRFSLSTGQKSSFSFPLGIKANTLHLDDLAAVDGKLYALFTHREWWTSFQTYTGGAQMVVAIGKLNTANKAPQFTQAPKASPSAVTMPLTTTVSALATDLDGQSVSYFWTKVSGPAPVTFSRNGTSLAASATASFTEPGTYVLGCRATDGDRSAFGNVTVTVGGGSSGGGGGSAVATVKVVPIDSSASESNDTAKFKITRSGGDTTSPLAISYTYSGTATQGGDYTVPSTIVIPANSTTIRITVTPINDSIIEGSETIRFDLLNDSNYNFGSGSSTTITLTDND